MKLITILTFAILGYTLKSCFVSGGTVGRIGTYEFDISQEELEENIEKVVNLNSDLEFIDSDEYVDYLIIKDKDTSSVSIKVKDYKAFYAQYRYLSVDNQNERYIFRFRVHMDGEKSRINLVSGALYGKGLEVSKNISSSNKKKYCEIFEEKLINRVIK